MLVCVMFKGFIAEGKIAKSLTISHRLEECALGVSMTRKRLGGGKCRDSRKGDNLC